jgi:hypothetical protein
MMLLCGHVISRDSLQKLPKSERFVFRSTCLTHRKLTIYHQSEMPLLSNRITCICCYATLLLGRKPNKGLVQLVYVLYCGNHVQLFNLGSTESVSPFFQLLLLCDLTRPGMRLLESIAPSLIYESCKKSYVEVNHGQLTINQSLLDFFLGGHHKGTILIYGLVQGLSSDLTPAP